MKKGVLFLFMCILSLCACETTKDETEYITQTIEKTPIDPHIPSTEMTPEKKADGLKQDIAGLSKIYNKMKTWQETDPNFTEGMTKAAELENTYGKRIQEIISISPEDLTEKELEELSTEIHNIVPAIREVNDMFEFR